MATLRVAYDAGLPHARWGPLFHVFRLERPDVTLHWQPVGFPVKGACPLEHADVGVLLHPRDDDGLASCTLDESPMVVLVAAGHPLAQHVELTVADVIDHPFPGGPQLDPEWSAFWTLDEQRGGPAPRTDDQITSADDGVAVVAEGRAIVTVPVWVGDRLDHPGIVPLRLVDGPRVTTRLIWRRDDDNPVVHALADLAADWTRDGRGDGHGRR
jgi:DNA-binding transcriptional LysR family regulator